MSIFANCLLTKENSSGLFSVFFKYDCKSLLGMGVLPSPSGSIPARAPDPRRSVLVILGFGQSTASIDVFNSTSQLSFQELFNV